MIYLSELMGKGMKLDNILRCGYTFTEDEYELETRYRVTTISMLIITPILLLASLFYYVIADFTNAYVHLFAFFMILIAMYLARVVGKDQYTNLVYLISFIFTLIIMFGYYATP